MGGAFSTVLYKKCTYQPPGVVIIVSLHPEPLKSKFIGKTCKRVKGKSVRIICYLFMGKLPDSRARPLPALLEVKLFGPPHNGTRPSPEPSIVNPGTRSLYTVECATSISLFSRLFMYPSPSTPCPLTASSGLIGAQCALRGAYQKRLQLVRTYSQSEWMQQCVLCSDPRHFLVLSLTVFHHLMPHSSEYKTFLLRLCHVCRRRKSQ